MPLKNKTIPAWAILGLLAATIAAYSNSFNIPFMLDDIHMLVNNAFITHPKYFYKFFTGYVTSFPVGSGMCRPFLMLGFALNYAIGQLNVISYHIVNLALHFTNGLLLFVLLKNLKNNINTGILFAITALFLVHPMNTEAVSYISSRSDLISALVALLFFNALLKKRFLILLCLYPIGLLFKETALFLILFTLGYGIFYYTKWEKSEKNRFLYLTAYMLLITFIYLFYRALFFSGTTPGNSRPILSNILLESWVSFFYLKLFFWPDNINLLHAHPLFLPPFNSAMFLPSLFISALIPAIFFLKKKRPVVSAGLLFLLCALMPKFYSTLKTPVAEHHFYIASIGLLIVIASALNALYIKIEQKNTALKHLIFYPLAGICLCFTLLTFYRNWQLSSPIRTWRQGIEKEPKHIGNWINHSVALKQAGYLDEAKRSLEAAQTIAAWDKDWQAAIYTNMASIEAEAKDFTKAKADLDKALSLNPKPARIFLIYNQLAQIAAAENNHTQAHDLYKAALIINPYSLETTQALCDLFLSEKNILMASFYLNLAKNIKQDDFYNHFIAARLNEAIGNKKAAKRLLQKSISLNPKWFYTRYALALIYLSERNMLAADELEKCLELKPDFQPALRLKEKILKDLN